jgi:hypothetical protein
MKNLAKTLAGKLSEFDHEARHPKAREKPKNGKKTPKTDFAGKWSQPKQHQLDQNRRQRMKPNEKRRRKAQENAGKPRQKAEKAAKRTAGATAGKPTPLKWTLPR